jgi:maltose O-acetyltransferase
MDLRRGVFGLFAPSLAGAVIVPRVVRLALLKALGLQIGRSHILPGVEFSTARILIGDRVFVNRGCFFDAHGVTLEDGVSVGCFARFITASHHIGGPDARAGGGFSASIVVKRGSWIGANALIFPGVTIGAGCVIAAGAVVTKDCEPNGLYAGTPARRIRDL